MAAVADIRTRFKDTTGRDDLTDAKIDEFIWTGQKVLDRLAELPQLVGFFFKNLVAGDKHVDIANLRSVIRVTVDDGVDKDPPLVKVRMVDLRETYTEPWANVTPGRPLHYAIGTSALATEQSASEPAALTHDAADVTAVADRDTKRRVMFMPPADKVYTLRVECKFFTEKLSDSATTNFWSSEHPELLNWAACWAHEVRMQNTTRAEDWMRQIRFEMDLLDNDAVEEMAMDVVRRVG